MWCVVTIICLIYINDLAVWIVERKTLCQDALPLAYFEYITRSWSFSGIAWQWLFPESYHRCGASLRVYLNWCVPICVCMREGMWKKIEQLWVLGHSQLKILSLKWCLCVPMSIYLHWNLFTSPRIEGNWYLRQWQPLVAWKWMWTSVG